MAVFNPDGSPWKSTTDEAFSDKPQPKGFLLTVPSNGDRSELREAYKTLTAGQLATHLRAMASALKSRCREDNIKLRGYYKDLMDVLDGTIRPDSIPVPMPDVTLMSVAEAAEAAAKDEEAMKLLVDELKAKQEQAEVEAAKRQEEQDQAALAHLKLRDTMKVLAEELEAARADAAAARAEVESLRSTSLWRFLKGIFS